MSKKESADFTYPHARGPSHGVPLMVAEGVYWLRVTLPFDLDHINLWLIDKGATWALVDTGCSAPVTREVWDRLLSGEMADKPIDQIIVTHFHPDHIGLAMSLSQHFNCDTWMTSETRQRTQYLLTADNLDPDNSIGDFYRTHGVEDPQPFIDFCTGYTYRMIVEGMPTEIKIIGDDETIEVGNMVWKTMVVGGHAEGHMILYNEKLNVFISGDQVLPSITSNIGIHANNSDANPLLEYMQSLERFNCVDRESLVLPSHGKVFYGIKDRIEKIMQHHGQFLEKIMGLCDSPRTAYELLPLLFSRKLDELHSSLAFGEALAHLVYLENEQKLNREEVDGVFYFSK